jgi:transcriptional regulator with XRE-family HTH domain
MCYDIYTKHKAGGKMNNEMKYRLQIALDRADKKAVDLSKALNIPKSAISQYLSGRSKSMPSDRLYLIAEYLDVDEAWLMGFDVPMERKRREKNSINADAVENEGISDSVQLLIEYAKTVPDDKAELVLRVMKSILEDSQ